MRRRLSDPMGPGRAERDVDVELRFHVDERVAGLVREGWAEADARREVERTFGDYGEVAAACRRHTRKRMRGEAWRAMKDGWRQDLRLAARGLLLRPRFALSVIVTLGLGIGASAAVFSVVDAVLLRPLPYPEADRLVRIYQQNSPENRWSLSAVDVHGLEERQRAFASVGGFARGEAALGGGSTPEWVVTGWATGALFETLGVEPSRGRAFSAEEGRPGGGAVALVTTRFARRRFGGGNPIGATLLLDGEAHTVVGELPPAADDIGGMDAGVWLPLRLEEPTRRGPFFIAGVGRLRDGVGLAAARADLARVSEEIFPAWASSFADRSARLTPVPLLEALVGDVRSILRALQIAVALVLLIAFVNVVNLVLARAAARHRELDVRAALGAGRVRLTRMLMVEGVALALLGGAAGMLLASGAVAWLRALAPDLPRVEDVVVGARTSGLAVLVTLVAGALFGAAPALTRALGGTGGRGPSARGVAGDGAQGLRQALVAGEVALALPLLAGALLLTGSLARLQRVDPGFPVQGVAAVRVSLPDGAYPGADDLAAFWEEALRRVRARPGVVAAGIGGGLPPDAPAIHNNFDFVDRPVEAGTAQPVAPWIFADDGFLEALGVPLLEGRGFLPSDADGGSVVLLSRSLAERFYPGESAVGRQLVSGGCTSCPPTIVVGVVGDVKYDGLGGGADAVYAFLPFASRWWRTAQLVVRGRGPAGTPLADARAAIQGLDPGLPLDDAATLEARMHDSLAAPRRWSLLLGAFSVAAAALAAVGLFGVLSYTVSRQTREIGVRMALGAGRGTVVARVVRQGMTTAAVGAAAGVALALPAGRLLEGQLFGTEPVDPKSLASAVALVLAVALVASLLPARRAARVDPVVAIAAE